MSNVYDFCPTGENFIMKVKELEKTVNLAWSPKSQYPILLAAATTAQQLDASFSTTASLDIYSVNLGDPSMDLELRHSVSSELRLDNYKNTCSLGKKFTTFTFQVS